eukprot:40808_1
MTSTSISDGEIQLQQMNGEIEVEEEKLIEISVIKNYPSLTLQQSNETSECTPTPFSFSEFNYRQKSYRKSFLRMFNELMNVNERRTSYFICFLTLCCGALRLIFFVFMGSIIDLLANTYNKNLHKI